MKLLFNKLNSREMSVLKEEFMFMKDYIIDFNELKGKEIKEIGNLRQGGYLYIITSDCKWTIFHLEEPTYSDYSNEEIGIYAVDNSYELSELLEGDDDFVEVLGENIDFNFNNFLEEIRERNSKNEKIKDLRNLKYLIEKYKDEASEIIKYT